MNVLGFCTRSRSHGQSWAIGTGLSDVTVAFYCRRNGRNGSCSAGSPSGKESGTETAMHQVFLQQVGIKVQVSFLTSNRTILLELSKYWKKET